MPDHSRVFRLIPHLLVPTVLVLLGIVSQYSGLDEWLIRPFYDESSRTWPYESAWLTSEFLHRGGKYFIEFMGAVALAALISSFFYEPLSTYRWELVYAMVGAVSGIVIVGFLKGGTHMYSPSALMEYGGTRLHIRLFDPVPPGSPIGHAFPAGHASGGFSLIVFYFLLAVYGSKWRYAALGFCLTLGVVFGVAQQARGKHFFSHDLFALAVCWTVALLVLYVMRIPKRRTLRHAV